MTSANTISALLLISHVVVNFRYTTSALNAYRHENNFKLAELNLGQRYRHLLDAPANDNDVKPDSSSTRYHWNNDDVDENVTTDDNLTSKDERQTNNEKRKWAKNTVRVWGKRSDVDQFHSDEDNDEIGEYPDEGKRSWSKNKVRVWGKRGTDDEIGKTDRHWKIQMRHGVNKVESTIKRKWSNNKVRVWGKRGHDGEDEVTQHELSSSRTAATDRREKSTANPKLPTTSAAHQYPDERSMTGKYRGLRTGASENNDVTGNEDVVIDGVLRERAAIVKRAIEESVDRVDRLAWIPGEKSIFSPDPSLPWHGEYWTSAMKRVGSLAYAGDSSSPRVARYPLYSADGPKRSWRTNVIRVWGK